MAAGDVRLITGKHYYRKSIVGDGTGDYIQIDAWGVAREAAGTADTVGTLAGWIFRNTATNDDCLISAGDVNAAEYINLHVHNGYLNCTLADGGAPADFDIESDNLVVPPGGWYHIAVVQDGTQPILYVNGVAVAATNDISTDLTKWFADLNGIDNANIGILDQNTSTTMDIDGAIGYVKHWNLALTAADIMRDFQGVGARQAVTDALISYWDWDGDLVDGVSGHDGTIVNNVYLDAEWSEITYKLHAQRALGGVTDVMTVHWDSKGNITYTIVENT